jgi:tellurite resistance protein TehA-like permease
MWWFGAAWMMATLLFVVLTLIRRHSVYDEVLPLPICIPAVGVTTLALVDGLVSSFSNSISARLAVPVIVASFWAVGVGLSFAIMLYTILFHSLLKQGWPPAEQIGTMFILVGPLAQSAAALQVLGSAADTYSNFAGYHMGTFLQRMAAAPLDVACILLALLLTGMAAVWLLIAFYAMAELAYKRQLKWTLSWNAIIFPTGTLATSTLQLGIEMDSPFFRVITAIILVFMVFVFFVNLGFTVFEIVQGRLLIVMENPRIAKEE